MRINIFKNKFNNKFKIKNLGVGILFSQNKGKQIKILDNKIKLKLQKLENFNNQMPSLEEYSSFRFLKRYSIIRKTYGIGLKKATNFFNELGLNSRLKIIKKKALITKKLRFLVNTNTLSKDLSSRVKSIISFHINLKSYRGIRHKYNYPVRGQRTHTNGKTRKKHNKKKNKKVYGKKAQKKLLQKKSPLSKKLQKNKKS